MADAPENTLPSFRLALELGATGVESDVFVTSDEVAVLDHDGRVGSVLRRKPIAEVGRDELPDHIPTLTELFETVGPTFPISLDLKDPDSFGAVIESARAFDPMAEQNLWICHPDLDLLTSWRPRTSANLVNSVRLRSLPQGLERRAAELQQLGIEAVNLHHSEWSGGRVALAHRFDRLAFGWGVKHERELAVLIDAGIDAVYSDHVDRMMAMIGQFFDQDHQ